MRQTSSEALAIENLEETTPMLRTATEGDSTRGEELNSVEGSGHQVPGNEGRGSLRISLPSSELIIGLFLLAGTIFYLVEAFNLPKPYNPTDIGAGGFPKLLAIGTLIFLGIMLSFAGYHRLLRRKTFGTVSIHRPLWVLLSMVLVVGQACFFEKLGVSACVGLSSVLVMLVCGERRLVHLVGVPVSLVGFIYMVFVFALNVNLP